MPSSLHARFGVVALLACYAGCSSDSAGGTPNGVAIVTASGAPLRGQAGDALRLKAVQTLSDGSMRDLPAGAVVTWSGPPLVSAAPPGTDVTGAVPIAPGAGPTAILIANPSRTDRAKNLAGVVFLLDAGTLPSGVVSVSADVSGVTPGGHASATIDVTGPAPEGDATRGKATYGVSCAGCHGATGHGSPAGGASGDGGGTTYSLGGVPYPFPAPGLNAEDGNPASDPEWNAALFATAARADIDNAGVTLRAPMPDWLTEPSQATNKTLSTADFADVLAFLKTQKQ